MQGGCCDRAAARQGVLGSCDRYTALNDASSLAHTCDWQVQSISQQVAPLCIVWHCGLQPQRQLRSHL